MSLESRRQANNIQRKTPHFQQRLGLQKISNLRKADLCAGNGDDSVPGVPVRDQIRPSPIAHCNGKNKHTDQSINTINRNDFKTRKRVEIGRVGEGGGDLGSECGRRRAGGGRRRWRNRRQRRRPRSPTATCAGDPPSPRRGGEENGEMVWPMRTTSIVPFWPHSYVDVSDARHVTRDLFQMSRCVSSSSRLLTRRLTYSRQLQ